MSIKFVRLHTEINQIDLQQNASILIQYTTYYLGVKHNSKK